MTIYLINTKSFKKRRKIPVRRVYYNLFILNIENGITIGTMTGILTYTLNEMLGGGEYTVELKGPYSKTKNIWILFGLES